MEDKVKKIMFIGRWQVPQLHAGHRALIQAALDEGHTAIIAIRDTEKDDKNPYSAAERMAAIREIYPDSEQVEICIIPDLDEIWVGRDVGYRVVVLSKELESISGTEIRKNDNLDNGQ